MILSTSIFTSFNELKVNSPLVVLILSSSIKNESKDDVRVDNPILYPSYPSLYFPIS